MIRTLTQIWAWFGAVIALGSWPLGYRIPILPQIALELLSVVGYGLATMYYLNQNESLRRRLVDSL